MSVPYETVPRWRRLNIISFWVSVPAVQTLNTCNYKYDDENIIRVVSYNKSIWPTLHLRYTAYSKYIQKLWKYSHLWNIEPSASILKGVTLKSKDL